MRLPITSYLNQKVVFDLLAVIEDGFSEMKKIETNQRDIKSLDGGVQAELGYSNIFNLIGINLKGNIQKNKSSEDGKIVSEEKIHTPTSLFSKLLTYLEENNMIHENVDISSYSQLKHGDFVSFSGKLKQSPLYSLLCSFESLGVLMLRMETQKSKKDNTQDVLKQIKALRDSLIKDDMFDIICEIDASERFRAILPVNINYFFNKNMSDIIDGEFTIVGKVVRIVTDEDDEPINLLRNSSFSLFKRNMIDVLFSNMNSSMDEKMDIENLELSIQKPVILVIPIAIYT